MFNLTPVLGDIRVSGDVLRSAGNSTRWIIEVTQTPPRVAREIGEIAFELVRNGVLVRSDAFTFSLGAFDPEMYDARPHMEHEDGQWVLRAFAVKTSYLLSIDILHSLYR
jgi:hypothetical protein